MQSMIQRSREVIVRHNSLLVGAFGLVGLAMVIYGILAGLHADTASYATFMAPIISVLLGLLVVAKQLDDVKDKQAETHAKLTKVEEQTNGMLTAQFADLRDHMETVATDTVADAVKTLKK